MRILSHVDQAHQTSSSCPVATRSRLAIAGAGIACEHFVRSIRPLQLERHGPFRPNGRFRATPRRSSICST